MIGQTISHYRILSQFGGGGTAFRNDLRDTISEPVSSATQCRRSK